MNFFAPASNDAFHHIHVRYKGLATLLPNSDSERCGSTRLAAIATFKPAPARFLPVLLFPLSQAADGVTAIHQDTLPRNKSGLIS